jgi:hypothetical protein
MTEKDQRDEMLDRRLLTLLKRLRQVPQRDPRAAARGREMFLSEAKSLGQPTSAGQIQRLIGWINFKQKEERVSRNLQFFWNTRVAVILTVAVMFLGGTLATAAAAQSALPGTALYSVKLAIEDAQLILAQDKSIKSAQLRLRFVQKRVDEIASLIAEGRYDDIPGGIHRYESQLQQAVDALATAGTGSESQGDQVALLIGESLPGYTQTLNGLRDNVPVPAQTAISHAISATERFQDTMEIGLGNRFGMALENEDDNEVEFTGTVEAIGDEAWIINGQVVSITPETEIEEDIDVDDEVEFEVLINDDGSLTVLDLDNAVDGGENVVDEDDDET